MACMSASVVSVAVASDNNADADAPPAAEVVIVAGVVEELLLEHDDDMEDDSDDDVQLLDASELEGVVVDNELLAIVMLIADVIGDSSSCLSQRSSTLLIVAVAMDQK